MTDPTAPSQSSATPRRHKTVTELIALLSAFPPDTPIASCADEFGTYWDITPKLERLSWRGCSRDEPDWVWFWPDGIPNGTETDHVIF